MKEDLHVGQDVHAKFDQLGLRNGMFISVIFCVKMDDLANLRLDRSYDQSDFMT